MMAEDMRVAFIQLWDERVDCIRLSFPEEMFAHGPEEESKRQVKEGSRLITAAMYPCKTDGSERV